jgi:hypothetical protein
LPDSSSINFTISGVTGSIGGYVVKIEPQTAAAGQTVFTLATTTYVVGVNCLHIYIDGIYVRDFTETSTSVVTLSRGCAAGQSVLFVIGRFVSGGVDAGEVSYVVGSVSRSLSARLDDLRTVTDNGADSTGTNDAASAFNASTAVGTIIPPGTYKTGTQPTNPLNAVAIGATFTGAAAYDSWHPAFGTATMRVYSTGSRNAFVGIARNTASSSSSVFPTGVTGYGRNDNAGNCVFGVYAEARQYANSGVVTNEIDSFNMTATPASSNLPPDRSIGTAQQHPVALTIGAGGSSNSSIGIHIAQEGSSPQSFLTGIYTSPAACTYAGIFIDAAVGVGPTYSAVFKHKVTNFGVQIQGVGTPIANNAFLQYVDGNGIIQMSFKQGPSIELSGTKVIGTRVTGFTAMTGSSNNGTAYDTSTVTLAQLAGRVMALQAAVTTHGLIGA